MPKSAQKSNTKKSFKLNTSVDLSKLNFNISIPNMAALTNSTYSLTIEIDAVRSIFHFYTMLGKDKHQVSHHVKGYTGNYFDADFFKKFKEAVAEFVANNPSDKIRKVSVIIPDTAVLTDMIKVPTMSSPVATKKALNLTMGGLYRNYNDLRILSRVTAQNRQYTTYAIAAVQKYIASSIFAACSENKLLVDTLTFASNASVSGAMLLNSRMKSGSYLFLDLKDTFSRFVFVTNGKTTGFYTLPFGLEFLSKPKVIQEDLLFNHSYAELAVINAREKAKSKKLTVMAFGDDTFELDEEEELEQNKPLVSEAMPVLEVSVDGEDEESDPADAEIAAEIAEAEAVNEAAEENATVRARTAPKLFTRKAARKLPKFMQRPVPETEEGILYENFRIFVKWALTLIQGNSKITEIAKPDVVYVNIPDDKAAVLDEANKEAEENGITFVQIPYKDEDADLHANLELLGGIYLKQFSSANRF